jgi:hypothetical protein
MLNWKSNKKDTKGTIKIKICKKNEFWSLEKKKINVKKFGKKILVFLFKKNFEKLIFFVFKAF